MEVLRLTLTLLALLVAFLVVLVVTTVVRRGLRERASRRVADRRSALRQHVVVALGLRRGDRPAATGLLHAAARGRHRQEVLDIFTSVATTLGGSTARPSRTCPRRWG